MFTSLVWLALGGLLQVFGFGLYTIPLAAWFVHLFMLRYSRKVKPLAGGILQEPFRAMTPGEQAAAALALLWIKPTYMLLSGVVSLFLLRRKAIDLRILGWSLLVFLIERFSAPSTIYF